jgi:hypothetical protein
MPSGTGIKPCFVLLSNRRVQVHFTLDIDRDGTSIFGMNFRFDVCFPCVSAFSFSCILCMSRFVAAYLPR